MCEIYTFQNLPPTYSRLTKVWLTDWLTEQNLEMLSHLKIWIIISIFYLSIISIFLTLSLMEVCGVGVDCACCLENVLQRSQFSVLIFVTLKPNDNFLRHLYWHLCKQKIFDFPKILSCISSGHNQPTPLLLLTNSNLYPI